MIVKRPLLDNGRKEKERNDALYAVQSIAMWCNSTDTAGIGIFYAMSAKAT